MTSKVSVIIPLYNKEAHIGRALDSVLDQTVRDLDILVIDDKSTDEGPSVVRKYKDPRVRFVEQDHRGVSKTRNHGIELARSDFIAFLDADDEWTPHHLEILLRMRYTFPGAGLYSTAYQWRLKSGRYDNPGYRGIPKFPFEGLLPDYFKAAMDRRVCVLTCSIGIPKRVLVETGGFREDISMGEDNELWARIALHYPVAFSSETGAVIHEDADNRACDTYFAWYEEDPVVTYGKQALSQGVVPREMVASYRKYLEHVEIKTIQYHIFFGNYTLAKKILARAELQHFRLEKIRMMFILGIPGPVLDRIKAMKQWYRNKLEL
jgi:glycosyltransferase involved in cell wall biosynthesis